MGARQYVSKHHPLRIRFYRCVQSSGAASSSESNNAFNEMSITELFQEAAFEADRVVAMTTAFDLACRSLPVGGYSDLLQEIIAKRIISCARDGVADPVLLCRAALGSLGLQADAD